MSILVPDENSEPDGDVSTARGVESGRGVYNAIASRGKGRIAALSDGVFAIAMTLIVLGIRLPDLGPQATNAQLGRALASVAPQFVTYVLSFLTLGIFWGGQQTQLNYFEGANRDLAWIHLAFLAAVALLPFSTSVLADHYTTRAAVVVYWANLALLGIFIYGSWAYATRAGLLRPEVDATVAAAVRRRIVVYQLLYAAAAALCVIDPLASLAGFVLLQLNSAIAPRVRVLSSF